MENTNILTGERLDLMKGILFAEQEELHSVLVEQLKDIYPYVWHNEEVGVYAPGDIPVILLAHFDTVHKVKPTEESLFYDTSKNQMACINNGIGADCRAGVFNIIEILQQGYRPHVFFSWNEEIGCVGTGYFTQILQAENTTSALLNEYMSKINFAIQFDRRGFNEAVYYDLDNQEFEDYISGFGFETQWGSYTDIAELCPVTGFAGVNLSAGYTDEHTHREILHVDEMLSTQRKAINILEDQVKNPKFFEYKEISRAFYGGLGGYPAKAYGYSTRDIYDYEGKEEDTYQWTTSQAEKDYWDDQVSFKGADAKDGDSCFVCQEEMKDGVNWVSGEKNVPSYEARTCFHCRDRYYGEAATLPQWWIDEQAVLGVEINSKVGKY